MILWLWWLACTAADPAPAGSGAAPTTDTGPAADPTTGTEPAFDHYMSEIAVTVTPADTATSAQTCVGEAHLSHYTDGSFLGFASCEAGDPAWSLAGRVDGQVVQGIVDAVWEAESDAGSWVVTVLGLADGTTLDATVYGTGPAGTVDGSLTGTVWVE
jgi:hypothetical protein